MFIPQMFDPNFAMVLPIDFKACSFRAYAIAEKLQKAMTHRLHS